MTITEQAIDDLRTLMRELTTPIDFNGLVSRDYAQGYMTGRRDAMPHIDATVTAIIELLNPANDAALDRAASFEAPGGLPRASR